MRRGSSNKVSLPSPSLRNKRWINHSPGNLCWKATRSSPVDTQTVSLVLGGVQSLPHAQSNSKSSSADDKILVFSKQKLFHCFNNSEHLILAMLWQDGRGLRHTQNTISERAFRFKLWHAMPRLPLNIKAEEHHANLRSNGWCSHGKSHEIVVEIVAIVCRRSTMNIKY